MTLFFFAHALWWAIHLLLFRFFLEFCLTFSVSFLLRFRLILSRLFFSFLQWSSGNSRSSLGLKERLERWCMHQVDTDRKVSNVVVCKANWQGDFKSQGASQTYSLVQACWLTQLQKLENPVQPFSPSAPFGLKECRFGRAALVLQSQTSSIRLRTSYQVFIGAIYGSQGTDPHPCNETGTLGQEELSTN